MSGLPKLCVSRDLVTIRKPKWAYRKPWRLSQIIAWLSRVWASLRSRWILTTLRLDKLQPSISKKLLKAIQGMFSHLSTWRTISVLMVSLHRASRSARLHYKLYSINVGLIVLSWALSGLKLRFFAAIFISFWEKLSISIATFSKHLKTMSCAWSIILKTTKAIFAWLKSNTTWETSNELSKTSRKFFPTRNSKTALRLYEFWPR